MQLRDRIKSLVGKTITISSWGDGSHFNIDHKESYLPSEVCYQILYVAEDHVVVTLWDHERDRRANDEVSIYPLSKIRNLRDLRLSYLLAQADPG